MRSLEPIRHPAVALRRQAKSPARRSKRTRINESSPAPEADAAAKAITVSVSVAPSVRRALILVSLSSNGS